MFANSLEMQEAVMMVMAELSSRQKMVQLKG
jgi:hypothetical protein